MERNWPRQAAPGTPAFGINFSCNYAEFLLLEEPGGLPLDDNRPDRTEWCATTFGRLLEETGARHVRLSVEWSQVEPVEGRFDFTLVDALLAEAERRGAAVLLTVGLKGQRHPEYYLPNWALAEGRPPWGAVIQLDSELGRRALAMVRATVAHVAGSAAIDSWGADNEPYVTSPRADRWALSRELVQAEVAAIHESDPLNRPVSIGHAQIFAHDTRWRGIVEDADAMAVSIYPFRNVPFPGRAIIFPIMEMGPLTPNFPAHAREAAAAGDAFWITEMQAEPWAEGDIRLFTPSKPSPNLDTGKFRRSLDYARRSGASRVYLWGSEWWLFTKERQGDARWMEMGRAAITAGATTAPGPTPATGGASR
ncbi:MAG: beta-galactosidase [Chloroflexi bacterium]|nr:beta-galactosidase [Chloroflexota bacterium]